MKGPHAKEPIGCYLRRMRVKRGRRQDEVAKELNVTPATLCRVENGVVKSPTFVFVAKLCHELKIDIEMLSEFVRK